VVGKSGFQWQFCSL